VKLSYEQENNDNNIIYIFHNTHNTIII